VNASFIKTLGPKLFSDGSLSNARFITTAKSGSDEFVTIFETRDGKFGGITLKLSARPPNCGPNDCTMKDVFDNGIGPWLEPIKGSGRLYIVGDDLEGINPTQLARTFNLDVIRRNDRILKDIRVTETRLAQIQSSKLDRSKTKYINGLPRNTAEAVQAGYQRSQVQELQEAAKKMDDIAKQFFKENWPPISPQTLQELFVNSESDVVLIVAHSDRERIYLNGTLISIDDIAKYPDRLTQSTKPRVAILLTCYGSNFGIKKGILFKKDLNSLAEVLVMNGYFDKVVAPKGEIDLDQAASILGDYLSGRLIREIAAEHYEQLLQVAELYRQILRVTW
jgi:hypothetical protein